MQRYSLFTCLIAASLTFVKNDMRFKRKRYTAVISLLMKNRI